MKTQTQTKSKKPLIGLSTLIFHKNKGMFSEKTVEINSKDPDFKFRRKSLEAIKKELKGKNLSMHSLTKRVFTEKDKDLRNRSAAYPFQIPYRLINMFSVQNDTVLDPFLGTGTTTLASIASKRNSIGYDIDKKFESLIIDNVIGTEDYINDINLAKNEINF